MRLPFGFEIGRQRAPVSIGQNITIGGAPASASSGSGWFSIISEPFTGAWQRNISYRRETVLAYSAVWGCVNLITGDISKMVIDLVESDKDDIWTKIKISAFSPVLKKPNRYQNRIKFIESWLLSKLIHGNTYILKERDDRNVVVALYVLDPLRTKVLVTEDGGVYYQVSADNLAGIDDSTVTIPASEIIHDRGPCIFHPLVGVSALYACGLAAIQGMSIIESQARFFKNGSQPSGVLTAPGEIDDPTAERFKRQWEQKFMGPENTGRIAVLGNGLTYNRLSMSAVDSQLIEQLKWSAETVCSAFLVPPYKIGIGQIPGNNNIEALDQQYYSQCLQIHIEGIELCLNEGLGLSELKGREVSTQFDLDGLIRMDSKTKIEVALSKLKGLFTTNEVRKEFDKKPVAGGNTIWMQQQNYSLEALAKRDASDDPFGTNKPPSAPVPANDDDSSSKTEEEKSIEEDALTIGASWSLQKLLISARAAA